MTRGEGMNLREAVRVLRSRRAENDIMISTMGTAREWMAAGPLHALDLVFVPSAMGHATSVGLGLALARPDHRVVVANGDGSMLMNLGSLVSITAAAPANLVVVVFDNGVYEVTGSQTTPGAPAGRATGDRVDYGAIAAGCGFRSIQRFTDLGGWRDWLADPTPTGPTFVVLEVAPTPGAVGPRSPGPAGERGRSLRAALAERTP